MPETRTRRLHRDNILIAEESYEVSDAQIEREQAPTLLRAVRRRAPAMIARCDAIATRATAPTGAEIKQLFADMADMIRALALLTVELAEDGT